ncbi:MAG: RpoD/SigA family RNA polymerase sigma factor [Scytonematopsis contorta HA4267-MV1]|jgi:RNA polymerase nonessential primary-like sigma factor|nr:RpoD/SigA family RNA polymerase sigma factor [Scytonematopsis contorta HA4267-MV1]
MSKLTSSSQPIEISTSQKVNLSTVDIVRTYLQEIGRIPLLTHEQELALGKQVQDMMTILDAKEKLTTELQHQATIEELADKLNGSKEVLLEQLNLGQKAKRKMIQANLRLVVSVAKKYRNPNMEFLDMIQEGTLGLERGVEKFDPSKGYKFSTYAYWWIRQAITRSIAQQARTIRLPIHIFEKLNKIKRVQRELSQKLGRTATVMEIAEALSLEPNQIRECLLLIRQPLSLDVRIGTEKDTELQEMLEDDALPPEDYVDKELLHQDIKKLLLKLNPQEREVLNLRFGFTNGQELSLAQVGQRMGISRERVRQIEKHAFKTLRRYKQRLNNYLAV